MEHCSILTGQVRVDAIGLIVGQKTFFLGAFIVEVVFQWNSFVI